MKIRFLPQDIICEIQQNQSVLDVAQKNNIFIKSVCGGVPSCAECRVRILDGEYNVLPPSSSELALIGTAHFVDRRRLSCQLRCFGDITVDLAEQVGKQQAQLTGKVKVRAGQREESIESHAIKGSILAESRSMLSPQGSSVTSSGAPSSPSAGAGPASEGRDSRGGALDRAPRQQQARSQSQQPSRSQKSSRQQQRPPQNQTQQRQGQPPQQQNRQRPPISDQAPVQGAQSAAPSSDASVAQREGGPRRRRRGGRGRNKNRGGGEGGGAPTDGSGGASS